MSDKENPIEAEVVSAQALAVRKESALPASISELEQNFALAVRQRELLADYIKKQLIPGKHFYEIRGQDKKSLTKEGAEIILLPHSLAPDYEIVSGPDQLPEGDHPYQITVKCTLRKKGDPNSFVGSGIGSASSHKGYWDADAKQWKYKLRQNDRGLCYNATVKMAQKSAMIAATINSTAASEFFTQDMGPGEGGAAVEPTTPKATVVDNPKPPPAETTTFVERCLKKMVKNLKELGKTEEAYNYLVKIGWLLDTERIDQLEERYVPRTDEQWMNFLNCLENFIADGDALLPYKPNEEENVPRGTNGKKNGKKKAVNGNDKDEPWRKFKMTHGKNKGIPLGELPKNYLFGLWANFKVEETWTDEEGMTRSTKPDILAGMKALRNMLDQAAKHYKFTKKEDKQ